MKHARFGMASQVGATMIEIMVAILVFSIGLLGIASTQTLGLTNTQSALSRSYAAQLSYEIVDIMRVNRSVTNAVGGVNIFNGLNTAANPFPHQETAGCNLANTACTPTELAAHQVAQWSNRVGTLLQGGQATLNLNGNTYNLVIRWVDIKNQDEAVAGRNSGLCAAAANNESCFSMSFQL